MSEKDPNGRGPQEAGAKLDAGKAPVWQGVLQYFPHALEAVAEVSAYGATKYSWGGWFTVPDGFKRYTDALGRHLLHEAKGELKDRDTQLLHAAHAAWNALARLEFLLHGGVVVMPNADFPPTNGPQPPTTDGPTDIAPKPWGNRRR